MDIPKRDGHDARLQHFLFPQPAKSPVLMNEVNKPNARSGSLSASAGSAKLLSMEVKQSKGTRTRRKSQSRKERKSHKKGLHLDDLLKGLTIEKYDSWDFGKVKKFPRPDRNPRNNKAAVQIQRYMRGWMARLKFRISMLQFKIENKDLLTWRALAKVKDKANAKKEKIKRKMLEKHEKSLAKKTKEQLTAEEGQRIIQQLREENRQLREKNQKIKEACQNLKSQNDRLDHTTNLAADNIDTLTKHAKHIKDTYEKLILVEPRYKQSVDELVEAVEARRQYCLTERRMKLAYVKCVGSVVDLAEDKLQDADLLDEIVGYVLDTEDVDHEEPLPDRVELENLDKNEEGSDDSIDEHSVATYDSDDD